MVLTPSTNHTVTYLFAMTDPGQRLQVVVPGTQGRTWGSRAAPRVCSLAAMCLLGEPGRKQGQHSLRPHLENGTEEPGPENRRGGTSRKGLVLELGGGGGRAGRGQRSGLWRQTRSGSRLHSVLGG